MMLTKGASSRKAADNMTQAEMIDYIDTMDKTNRENARTLRLLKRKCQRQGKTVKRKLNIGRCIFAVYLFTMFGLLLTNLFSKFYYLLGA